MGLGINGTREQQKTSGHARSARREPPPYTGRERRAVQRCRLQEAVGVRLSGTSRNGGSKWTVHGVMLNATPIGLACRVPARDLELLPAEGGMVTARFDLATVADGSTRRCSGAETRRRFELSAKVRSVTQAGTPGYFVVGMEFDFDESDRREQERLGEALSQASATV